MSIAGMTLHDAAIHYAELGYPVFPLGPRSKLPTKGSHGLLDATTDVEQVRLWWSDEPACNIGIRTNGLIVIDPDLIDKESSDPKPNPWLTEERARLLAVGPTQRTWTGGHQYIFRQPSGRKYRCTDSVLAGNVDTRGDDGYIVVAPSYVKKGKRSGHYRFAEGMELDCPPAALPEPPALLVVKLDEIEAARSNGKPSNGSGNLAGVTVNTGTNNTIPKGKRDGTLFSLGCAMRAAGMTQSEIQAALEVAARERCEQSSDFNPAAVASKKAEQAAKYEAGAVREIQEPGANGHAVASPLLVNLGKVVPRSVRWLWPGRIPIGKLTLIVGEPGLGKSLATMYATARITKGENWPDFPDGFNQAGSVVLLSAEDDLEDTVVPRLTAAGADLNFVTALQGIEFETEKDKRRRCFNLEQDLPHLEKAIDALADCRLVVIDPISSYLGKTDSHKNAELRGLLAPLAELASKREVAMLCVSHLNKSSGAKAMHRITGSLAFVAAARSAWLVTPDKADPKRRLFLPIKNNLAADSGGLAFGIVDGPCLAWEEGVVTITADDALSEESEKQKTRDRERAWLQNQLREGPLTQAFIRGQADQTGFSWASVRRAGDDLGIEKFKSGFRGGWSWKLPEGAQEAPSHTEESTFDVSSF